MNFAEESTLEIRATISMKNNDTPKIVLGSEVGGSHQVTFDLYGIAPTALIELVGKELTISISIGREEEWQKTQ